MGADTDTRTEREPLRKRIEGVIRDGLKAHGAFENALVFDIADAVLAALAERTPPAIVYRPEVQVPAAEMLTTDANQGWIVEYEEGDVWLIKPTLARWLYWNKATAKLAARTLARVGYRVRIVPLLRGTPVEIEGGSDGAQE